MSVTGTDPGREKKKTAGVVILCLVAVAAALGVMSLEGGWWQRPNPTGVAAQGGPRGAGYPGGGGGAGGGQMPGTRGHITAVSGSAITIQGRGGDAKTFSLTAATKITVDQKPVAAADLKVGQRARVVSTDNKSAAEVHIRTRPFGGPGGGRGGPGGGRGGYPGGPPGGAPASAVGIS